MLAFIKNVSIFATSPLTTRFLFEKLHSIERGATDMTAIAILYAFGALSFAALAEVSRNTF